MTARAPWARGGGLRLQVVYLEGGLLRFGRKATLDALLQPGHQDVVAELLPTLL
jgi:hypothetical protein